MNKALSKEMVKEFEKTIKIGLVATLDETSKPHITVLSTLMGKGKKEMMVGKFVEGLSKKFFVEKPKTGFLIMNTDKEFWHGTMNYSHYLKEGEDYIKYNNQPLYRYNSYFGINTVYYFKLNEISDKYHLPMANIIYNSILTMLFKGKHKDKTNKQVMNHWTKKFTAKLDTLTFISYINDDGYPIIIPVIQAQSESNSRIVFRNKPYKEALLKIKKNQDIAILAFSMTMETVLLKGKFSGFDKLGLGYLDIKQVYNAMPPVHGYIYQENETNV
ncbi:hypothetical protein ACAG96_07225 [Candidatus Izemoplasma sp. B36]|uniref:hypothetical protein n=1 Tax=Candidatus Izemoplasma sp. B36 TaxID=3242468 RepID=UPI003558D077